MKYYLDTGKLELKYSVLGSTVFFQHNWKIQCVYYLQSCIGVLSCFSPSSPAWRSLKPFQIEREMRWNELLLFTSICRISRLRCTAAYRLQERVFSEGSVYCNKIATYIENAVVSWIEKIYVNLPMCFKAVRRKQLAYFLRGLSGCVLYFPHNYDMIGLFLAGLNFLLPQSHS